jgi:hypothetical protein
MHVWHAFALDESDASGSYFAHIDPLHPRGESPRHHNRHTHAHGWQGWLDPHVHGTRHGSKHGHQCHRVAAAWRQCGSLWLASTLARDASSLQAATYEIQQCTQQSEQGSSTRLYFCLRVFLTSAAKKHLQHWHQMYMQQGPVQPCSAGVVVSTCLQQGASRNAQPDSHPAHGNNAPVIVQV